MQLRSFSSIALATVAYIEIVNAGFPITGVQTGVNSASGATPPRQNILDLYNDQAQFSLYIQALKSFQQVDENNLTSYFQVAGIHGRPYVSWDNVGSDPTGTRNGILTGYCTHGNTLFPTWHRPYLALYEASSLDLLSASFLTILQQLLAGFVQAAAKTYNSSNLTSYQTAADNFRIPFWDWAAVPQRFPDVMTWPSVSINTPSGRRNVTNPLYRYTFLNHPEPAKWFPTDQETYLGSQPWTIRQPDTNNVSNEASMESQFVKEGQFLSDQVWSVFAKTRNYNNMSTASNKGNAFEAPHGTVHVLIGGNGHMTYLSFSAFDPAFFLHHANVDRQIAMWQAIYPTKWLQPEAAASGTWNIYPNTRIDENTPLAPFTSSDGKTLYTSATSRSTQKFGYSYPDVPYAQFPNSSSGLSANVTARVNQLYNGDGHLGTWPAKRSVRVSGLEKKTIDREWSVAVEVSNAAVSEPFAVVLTVNNKLVGKMVVLHTPTKVELEAGADRCTHAEFTLRNALHGIEACDVPAVVAYLKGNLRWSVVRNPDGCVVSDVQGLEIEVADEIVEPANDISMFPSYSGRTVHPEITAGMF
ncbi:Polyphenol oxidase [Lachnellula occidentalis]|uniref:Polyphenol oxidase n=1 Tax=Lachnellula occidentalis TaxID=215460 RepID=A0A8H8RNN3_9HELO|nr:Polyphenol oxidase [Lachnellula occidentalis]